MSFAEDYIPAIKKSNQAFISLVFICFQYLIVRVGFAWLTTFAKWTVAGDHVAYANSAFDLIFVGFYFALNVIFIIHLVSFLWRNR